VPGVQTGFGSDLSSDMSERTLPGVAFRAGPPFQRGALLTIWTKDSYSLKPCLWVPKSLKSNVLTAH
jgi:hypothetical protein